MLSPNSTPFLNTEEEIINLMISTFPGGYLYRNNSGLIQIITGFAKTFYAVSKDIQKVFEDLFTIDKDNQFLDNYLSQYGLPNIIFPNIENNEQAAFAITMMKLAKLLKSEDDYINFLLLAGYEVKFYHYQNTLLDYHKFPYTLPMILGGVKPKNKITWLVYVYDNSYSKANLGVTAPMYLFNPSADTSFVKKILDYLKPDYIIFKFLTEEVKELYNIS